MLIAQISDLDLREAGALYQGVVDSNAMGAAAIAQLASLFSGPPDVVLVSGDVVDHGTDEEYACARELLDQISQPLVMLSAAAPGLGADLACRTARVAACTVGRSTPVSSRITYRSGPSRVPFRLPDSRPT